MALSITDNLKSFISDHWHGRAPYWLAVFINLMALRLLIGFIENPAQRVIVLPLIALSSIILIWQVTGAFRSSDRHYQHSGDAVLLWLAYLAIMISIGMTAIHTLDLSAGPPAKITTESLRERPMPEVSTDGTRVYLRGDLDFVHNQDLLTLLAADNKLAAVTLESNGGLIYAARALAVNIEKYKLDTHVQNYCNSACSIAFMAGKQRTLSAIGKIGFHQYKLTRQQPLQIKSLKAEQKKDREYFARRGVKQAFLNQLYQSEPTNIWQPERKVLLEAGVIHSLASYQPNASSEKSD